MSMTRRELMAAAAATGASGLYGGDRWSDTVAFIEGEIAAGTIPGAALIASRRGRSQFRQAWGTCCTLTNRQTPLSMETIHPLFSFSKLISATVIAMALDAELLDLTSPVSRWLPEFIGGGKETITLRHLLTHSAGIPNVPLGAVDTEASWGEAYLTVCAAKTEWAPGSRTFYHALSGLFVAACAARRVMGDAPWAELCRTRLFAPLGATSLSFALPTNAARVALTPQPVTAPASLRATFGFAGHPGAGCLGTPADALKVLHLHLSDGVASGKPLLSRAVLDQMHAVQYAHEIEQARAAGRSPAHEPWGLGPLLRGPGASAPSHDWFGFRNQRSPEVFGHAGIDTVIGVADRTSQIALLFACTNSPKPPEKTVPLRNGVTDRVFNALSQAAVMRSKEVDTP